MFFSIPEPHISRSPSLRPGARRLRTRPVLAFVLAPMLVASTTTTTTTTTTTRNNNDNSDNNNSNSISISVRYENDRTRIIIISISIISENDEKY